jgi:hypothetical protein
MAAMRKARSICTFVKRMNHLLRDPSLSSPVDSAQPTLPAGYSPPMPIVVSYTCEELDPCDFLPIPRKKRYATSAANSPVGLPPAPYEPVPSAAKTIIILVDANKDHFLE